MAIHVHFYGDLHGLLPRKKRGREVYVPWVGKRSVKDLIQSLNVPHTETGEIRVNGRQQDDGFIPEDGDSVDVFPVGRPDWRSHRGKPPCFLCDVHLRKLARRLRLLGFDTAFDPQWDDAHLAEISRRETRLLLTRDRGLLKRSAVEQGLLVRSSDPEEQVKEILRRLNIAPFINPFSRCLSCGAILEPANTGDVVFREKVKPKIPAKILQNFREFQYCPQCEKVFWKGSHHKKLSLLVCDYRNG